MPLRFAVAVAGAALVALACRRLRLLGVGGAWAASVIGVAVFGFTGWRGTLPLLVFFATSSLLGRLPCRAPHGPRSGRQVLANGGVAALAAALTAAGHPWALGALGGSLAAANADTWATEVGTRWGGVPRTLALGPPLAPGASGGMTPLGTAAGLAGAALIALVSGAWSPLVAGTVGLIGDSVLGALGQALYRCPACGARLETRAHGCGRPGVLVRGLPWLDNDGVNLAATALGAAVGALLR